MKFLSERSKSLSFCFAYFDVFLLTVQVIGSLQTAEQAAQHKDGSGCQNNLGAELCIGKTVQSHRAVEDEKRRDFQHNLSQDGKQQRFTSHANRLKDTDREEVDGEEGQTQTEAAHQVGAVLDDDLILHKQGYPEAREEEEEHCHRDDDRQGNLTGKADGVLHAGNVAAGIVVADQRHDAL